MALTGNETLQVAGVTPTGAPSGASQQCTTQQIANLGASTSTPNGFTGQQYFVQKSLTDASPIAWNLNTGQAAYVLLTSAVGSTRQLQNPTNMNAGGTYTLIVQQSASGSNVLTYGAAFKWPSGSAPTLSTSANAIDILTFVSNGTSMYGVAQLGFA